MSQTTSRPRPKDAARPRSTAQSGSSASAPLRLEDLVDGFRRVGLRAGQTTLVHSALRTFGPVDGGAETVVDALLAVLGPTGTLVVPTFTFIHEVEEAPIIDPVADRSEMGAISEAARTRPDARRSTAYRHSFAAIGRRAEIIAGVDPALAPYDLRSAFGVMLALDTQVLLLGVTYSNSTSHHFAEWMCDVPYRHAVRHDVHLRKPDGTVRPQSMDDYQPKPSPDGSYYGSRHTDFNFLGRMLEERGEAATCNVGNAIVRRFGMRELIALAEVEAARDVNVFRTAEGDTEHVTQLQDGVYVFSSATLDGAGRPEHRLWSVVEPERIVGWRPTWRVVRPDAS